MSPSMESIVTNFTDFEAPSPRPSPRSSRLSLPLKGSISKVTSSIGKTIRLSEDSLPRPSAMSSNQYLAADTNHHVSDAMILVSVVHQESTYKLLKRQCYWFADTIFGLLKKMGDDTRGWKHEPDREEAVYRRDTVHINKIWDKFAKERHIMDKQREGYEESRKEEIRKASELAGQVAKLQLEQAKER
ncbi:hypothetical protein F5887DRAFT_1282851 [Amanita rubescens]|nr:hypothetical protein F5887DRAFT_1282851 [Amanita rubescens]